MHRIYAEKSFRKTKAHLSYRKLPPGTKCLVPSATNFYRFIFQDALCNDQDLNIRLMGAAICEWRRTLVFESSVVQMCTQAWALSKALQLRTKGKCAETRPSLAHWKQFCAFCAARLLKPRRRFLWEVTAGHLASAAVSNSWRRSHFLLPLGPPEIFGPAQFIPAPAGAPPFISSSWIPNLLEQTEKRPSDGGGGSSLH